MKQGMVKITKFYLKATWKQRTRQKCYLRFLLDCANQLFRPIKIIKIKEDE